MFFQLLVSSAKMSKYVPAIMLNKNTFTIINNVFAILILMRAERIVLFSFMRLLVDIYLV